MEYSFFVSNTRVGCGSCERRATKSHSIRFRAISGNATQSFDAYLGKGLQDLKSPLLSPARRNDTRFSVVMKVFHTRRFRLGVLALERENAKLASGEPPTWRQWLVGGFIAVSTTPKTGSWRGRIVRRGNCERGFFRSRFLTITENRVSFAHGKSQTTTDRLTRPRRSRWPSIREGVVGPPGRHRRRPCHGLPRSP